MLSIVIAMAFGAVAIFLKPADVERERGRELIQGRRLRLRRVEAWRASFPLPGLFPQRRFELWALVLFRRGARCERRQRGRLWVHDELFAIDALMDRAAAGQLRADTIELIEDAVMREKYLKSGMGKRYLKNR